MNQDELRKAIEEVAIYNLTLLDLSGKCLSSLPESIGQLKKLKSLNLSGNQLTNLPEWIGQLTNLTELSLEFTQLTNLPESIGQLKKPGQPHTFLNKQEMTKTKQDNRYYLYAETLDGKASQPYSLDRNALWEIARPQSVTQHRP